MKASVERGLIESHKQFVNECINHLSEEKVLNCSIEKAMAMFDFTTVALTSKRSVAAKASRSKQLSTRFKKAARTAKPESIIPFCGEVIEDWCQAVRFNHGLHTQCTNGKIAEGEYCKTCSNQAENSSTDQPPYGDIRTRAKFGLDYRDPKGRQTVPFANIAKKLKLDLDKAKESAKTMGWAIPEEHLVLRPVSRGRPKAAPSESDGKPVKAKKRGRPKTIKVKAITTQDDLIAKLVSEASNELSAQEESGESALSGNESDSSVGSTKSKADLKAEKKAEKKAAKLAKAELKEAEKVAKAELKELEKVEKAELKKAEVVAKAAAKELEKVAKAELKEQEKVAKAAEKEAEKVAKAELKEQEKVLKAEAKELEKVLKAEAKELEKVLKAEAKIAAKAAKAEAKEAEKALKAKIIADKNLEPELETASIESEADSSDDEEEELSLPTIEVGGKKYLYDEDGVYAGIKNLLLTEDATPVGTYNKETKEITILEFEEE